MVLSPESFYMAEALIGIMSTKNVEKGQLSIKDDVCKVKTLETRMSIYNSTQRLPIMACANGYQFQWPLSPKETLMRQQPFKRK